MRVLIACEESQAVCKEFRRLGHEAYSCDILECSGGHPEWHIQGDVLPILKKSWDMIIAFPPCTYLTVTANKWLKDQPARSSGTLVGAERRIAREEAIEFFMLFANCDCPRVAIENPVGCMSSRWRKPDQIIQPWQFGDKAVKRTCLWLKELPLLKHTEIVEPDRREYNSKSNKSGKSKYPLQWVTGPSPERAKLRSKTYPGIAKAMAEQWSDPVETQGELF